MHNVFNPWFDYDPQNDIDQKSPEKRLSHLKQYLSERKDADFLLLAEALGYQGGHFSGIPMTSERILLGKLKHKFINPEHVFKGIEPYRTSLTSVKKDGFTEPTATIVWEELVKSQLDTRNFIFWNAFPWHPYRPDTAMLSNRTPSSEEIAEGIVVLRKLLKYAQKAKIIAVGKKAQSLLKKMGINAPQIRHPANGGATKFREQLQKEVTRLSVSNNT